MYLLQGWGQFPGHSASGSNKPLNVYFGKSAGKAGNHWGGGRLEHQMEDQCSWEDLDDFKYSENNPAEI